jgi:hypothetical protein
MCQREDIINFWLLEKWIYNQVRWCAAIKAMHTLLRDGVLDAIFLGNEELMLCIKDPWGSAF